MNGPQHDRQAEQRWADGPVWKTPPVPKPPPVLRFRPSPRSARLQGDKAAPRDAAIVDGCAGGRSDRSAGACLSSPHTCGGSPNKKRAAYRDNIVYGPAPALGKGEAAAPPSMAAAAKDEPSVAVTGLAAGAKAKPKDEGGLAKPAEGFVRTKAAWASPVMAPPLDTPDDGDVLAYPPEEAMPLPPPLPLPKSVGGSGHTLTLLSPEDIFSQAGVCHLAPPSTALRAFRVYSSQDTRGKPTKTALKATAGEHLNSSLPRAHAPHLTV